MKGQLVAYFALLFASLAALVACSCEGDGNGAAAAFDRTLREADFRADSPLFDYETFNLVALDGGVDVRNLPYGMPKCYYVLVENNELRVWRAFDMDSKWYKGQIRLEEVLAPLYDALDELRAARLRVPSALFVLNLADTGIKETVCTAACLCTCHCSSRVLRTLQELQVAPRWVTLSVARPRFDAFAPERAVSGNRTRLPHAQPHALHLLVPGPEFVRPRSVVDTLPRAAFLARAVHAVRMAQRDASHTSLEASAPRTTPFQSKRRAAVFRGGLHGRPLRRGLQRTHSARSLLARVALRGTLDARAPRNASAASLFDVRLTHIPHDIEEYAHHHDDAWRELSSGSAVAAGAGAGNASAIAGVGGDGSGSSAHELTFNDFQAYKAIVDVDGYGYSGSFVHHLLRSSLVLKVQPDWEDVLTASVARAARAERGARIVARNGARADFAALPYAARNASHLPLPQPNRHFFTVRRDLSDLVQRTKQVLAMQKAQYKAAAGEARRRVERALSYDQAKRHWAQLLVSYAAAQRFAPARAMRAYLNGSVTLRPCHTLRTARACAARSEYMNKRCRWFAEGHYCATSFVDVRRFARWYDNRAHVRVDDEAALRSAPLPLQPRRSAALPPPRNESVRDVLAYSWLGDLHRASIAHARNDVVGAEFGERWLEAMLKRNASRSDYVDVFSNASEWRRVRATLPGVPIYFVAVNFGVRSGRIPDRVFCALESAARRARTSPVFFVTLADAVWSRDERLAAVPNVRVTNFNATALFARTPLERLLRAQRLSALRFSAHVLADALRLALLYHFGGVYVDTDCFVLRSLNDAALTAYPTIGQQKWKERWRVNNAVLVFAKPRNRFLYNAMEHAVNASTDYSLWGALGPRLLTRAIAAHHSRRGIAQSTALHDAYEAHMNASSGAYNYEYAYSHFLPRVVHWRWFYPLHFGDIVPLVQQLDGTWSAPNTSYTVHFWANAWSKFGLTYARHNSIFARQMKSACPHTVQWKQEHKVELY